MRIPGHKRRCFITLIISQLVIAGLIYSKSGVSAQLINSAETKSRPRVGLVLSGGGALGYSHIGVLQVLQELRIPIDCVTGTSMGSLVAGIYANGISVDRMQHIISVTDVNQLFDDNPPRPNITQHIRRNDYLPLFDISVGYTGNEFRLPSGASAGYKFELFLKELIGTTASIANVQFDDLPIPYRAVATDLESGNSAVFSQGQLSKVMRASMSLPAILAPTKINDRYYVDGGLTNNLPVEVTRELCGDVLIVVNALNKPRPQIQPDSSTKAPSHSIVEVFASSIDLLMRQNLNASLQKLTDKDVLIAPDPSGFDSSSFDRAGQIIERGFAAAWQQYPKLAQLSVSEAEYQQWLQSVQARRQPQLHLYTMNGEDYEVKRLHREMIDFYGRGDLSYIGYALVPTGDNAEIDIEVEKKPWGPDYLKFGLEGATDFNSPNQLNLAASYRKTNLNSLGGEWRSYLQIGYDSIFRTEFYQPFQQQDGLFASPYLLVRRNHTEFYDKDTRLGDFESLRKQLGLDLGLSGTLGEIRLGAYKNRVVSEPGFGVANPLFTVDKADETGVEFSAIYDQLDRYSFPHSGLYTNLDVRDAQRTGDKPGDYTRAQLTIKGAHSVGNHTLSLLLEWGDEVSGFNDLPVYDAFKLGGPNRLSGLYLDQLSGAKYDLATLNYYYQYSRLPSQFGRGMYVGFSLESGRINNTLMLDPWERVTAGSLFWGADTVLGPVYLGFGYSSLKQSAWYLVIGPRF